MWQNYFIDLLNASINEMKKRNSSLSLRAYAQRVGISPGYLSEVLSGKRKVSKERARFIADKAQFPRAAQDRLNDLIDRNDGQSRRYLLRGEDIQLMTDIDYYRLIAAFEVLSIPCTRNEVLELLKIDPKKLDALLTTLTRIKIVRISGENLFWTRNTVTTTDDVPSEEIKNFHRRMLSETPRALALPVDEREFTSVIFGGTKSKISNGKKTIRNLRDLVVESMASSDDDCVYQLSIQLIPLSEARKAPRR